MASAAAQSSVYRSSAVGRSDSERVSGLVQLGADPVSLVYAATNADHTDWEMHVQLCDSINQFPSEGPRIIEAIKSRISSQNLDVAIHAVVLLESLVKNVSAILPLLAAGNFMDQLVQALPKRVREPQKKAMIHFTSASRTAKKLEKAEKILLLIQSLASAFDHNKQNNSALARWSSADREKMKVFTEVYHSLQRSGVTFPTPAEDENVPIITPAVAPKPTPAAKNNAANGSSSPTPAASGSYTDTECKVAFESCKLLSDILVDTARSNAGRSAAEVSSALRSNDIAVSLLASLNAAQTHFQVRLVDQQPSELTIEEIIAVNEIILRVMQFYRALEEGKTDSKTVDSFALVPESDSKSADGKVKPAGASGAQGKAAKIRSKDDEEKKERPAAKAEDQKTSFLDLFPLDLLSNASTPAKSAPARTPSPAPAAAASASIALNPFMASSAPIQPASSASLSPPVNRSGDHTPGNTPPASPKQKARAAPATAAAVDDLDPFLAIAKKSAAPAPLPAASAPPASSSNSVPNPATAAHATPFDETPASGDENDSESGSESVSENDAAKHASEEDDPFANIAQRK